MPGNPRCCCVRECQSPVLTGALAGGAPYPCPWGVPLQEVAAQMKVLYERVAGIDVHKEMVKVESPAERRLEEELQRALGADVRIRVGRGAAGGWRSRSSAWRTSSASSSCSPRNRRRISFREVAWTSAS